MSNTYNWTITAIRCIPAIDGKTDVISKIDWLCNGTDGVYNATEVGTVRVPYDPSAPFTAYDKLVRAEVLQWVWSSGVSVLDVQAELDKQLSLLSQPKLVSNPLPWYKNPPMEPTL